MGHFLGIDVGTSALKAVIIDDSANVLATAHRTYETAFPEPGWTEQDPEDWWQACQACMSELPMENVSAIGLTGQMHGSVFLDANGDVIRPALLWNDQRTTEECSEIEESVGKLRIREITLNPPLTGFQLPKILWLRNHELSNFQRVAKVLLPKDYIRFKLSGIAATDVSDASGTGAFSVTERSWSKEILESLDLDPILFPAVYESQAVCCKTDSGISIVAGAGDQAAAAISNAVIEPGVVSISLGTSGVVFSCCNKDALVPADAMHTFCHATGGWHRMGVMLSCGGAVAWAKNILFPNETYDVFDSAAEQVEAGSAGVRFLPYLAGERCPHNDPFATGAFLGLRASHSKSHLARSVLEGVSFALHECLGLVSGTQPKEVRVTGGGTHSKVWLQILADVLQCPLSVSQTEGGPALGAAILAGAGTGTWPNLAAVPWNNVLTDTKTEPIGNDLQEIAAHWRSLYSGIATQSPRK